MTTPALEIQGLVKYFGGLPATQNVSFSVPQGERRLLLGPNGAGKTTLFNLIAGDLKADKGSIRMFGEDITRLKTHQRVQRGLARTFQIITLFDKDTLLHNVTLAMLGLSSKRWNPLQPISRAKVDFMDRAHEVLATVGLDHLADRTLSQTSYGERRRLEIAMAMSQRPRVLLLDEPLAGLSREERADVQTLLENVPREVTMVIIEHDMDVALSLAEHITALHYGEVLLEGTREEVVEDPRIKEVYLGA
jgi:branched-chain amino acid transport system ATP-binding protein